LECAILSKNIDLANFLLDRGANVNSTSRNDRSGPGGALFAAIISGHNTLIPLLIDRGADVNAISRTSSGLLP
jgi:ankyrin repeat protein